MNKMLTKILVIFLVVSLCLYGVFWLFNHVNPWVSIGAFIVAIFAAIQYFFKQQK